MKRISALIEVLRGSGCLGPLIAVTCVMNFLLLVPSFYMMEIYDRVLTSRNEYTLLMLTFIALFLYAIYAALDLTRGLLVLHLTDKLERNYSQKIVEVAYERSVKKTLKNPNEPIADLSTVRNFINGNVFFGLLDAPWFPLYLLVVFVFSFWIGLFSALSVLCLAALAVYNEKKTYSESVKLHLMNVYANRSAAEIFVGSETVRSMGMFDSLQKKWSEINDEFLRFNLKTTVNVAKISSISKTSRIAIQSLVLGLSAFLVLKNEISSGMMIASSILVGRVLSPIDNLITGWRQINNAANSSARIYELINEAESEKKYFKLPEVHGFIDVKNLCVDLDGRRVLSDISFGVGPGDVLGVFGPSGSGKTSLIKALSGILPISSGEVRIDGNTLENWDPMVLGQVSGVLNQRMCFLDGTISENIARMGDVNPDFVVSAAKAIGIHELILSLKAGYQTRIGFDDVPLSGGQIQRVGIARALYANPRLLYLDEPNSSLDTSGLLDLIKCLVDLKGKNAAVVLVTHNIELLKVCNKLLNLEFGVVKAFGDSTEVLRILKSRRVDSNFYK